METISIDAIQATSAHPDDVNKQERLAGCDVQIAHAFGNLPANKTQEQQDAYIAIPTSTPSASIMTERLQTAFAKTAEVTSHFENGGSTATVAAVTPDKKITVAQLGDSYAMLFVKHAVSGAVTAHFLTIPQSASNPGEIKRVLASGGKIMHGILSREGEMATTVARSFGDKEYAGVSKMPEIKTVDIGEFAGPGDRAFLCVCSDGLFPLKTTEKVPEFDNINTYFTQTYPAWLHGQKQSIDKKNLEHYRQIVEQALGAGREQDIAVLMKDFGNSINRDNQTVLVAEIPDKRQGTLVMGVFDGHNPLGKTVANTAAETVKNELGKTTYALHTGDRKDRVPYR
jgi:serine/threonine protein phosphatase PrpC